MSYRATLYVKELRICPSGEPVSQREKLVLYALADYHQDKLGVNTYPSVATLADESMMDVRNCRRLLDSAERKGVLARERHEGGGRGHMTYYRFCELDKQGQAAPVPVSAKQGRVAPVSSPSLFLQKGGKRGAKGGQKGGGGSLPPMERAREREQEQEQPTPLPPPGGGAEKGGTLDSATERVMAGLGLSRPRERRRVRVEIERLWRDGRSRGWTLEEIIAEMIEGAGMDPQQRAERARRWEAAEEREAWLQWSTMSDEYRKANPWFGRHVSSEGAAAVPPDWKEKAG